MWAKDRFIRMAEFASKAQELGFTHIEANHWISPQALSELLACPVPISSIHSPCPEACSCTGVLAASLSLSSLDESERTEAVAFAMQTIDLGSTVGARAVVLHMGEVPIDAGLQDILHGLHAEGCAQTTEYSRTKGELVRQRTSRIGPHLDAARRSLRELAQHSSQKSMMLGLETRFHLHEIPNIDEMSELLCSVPAGVAGYWHDMGHAEVQQRLGFGSHEEWLLRFGKRMVGIHLHDVLGTADHYAPGKGDIDWEMVARNLPAGIVKVCEIGQWNGEEQLEGVVSFLHEAAVLR
jgi:sugar phosphate isomerase/epimerase